MKSKKNILGFGIMLAMVLVLTGTLRATPLQPAMTLQGEGLSVVTEGVGLEFLEYGTESISIHIGGPVVKAVLYWAGRNYPCVQDMAGGCVLTGEDRELLFNGMPISGTVVGTEINKFGATELTDNIGYKADVTSVVQAAGTGLSSFTIADNDAADFAELDGATLLVVYTDPAEDRWFKLILFEGLDFAYAPANPAPEARITTPVTFMYDPADEDRVAELFIAVGSADLPTRPDRIDISDNPSIVDQLNGEEGAQWDNLVAEINIPSGIGATVVEVVSPAEGWGKSESLLWELGGVRVPLPPVVPVPARLGDFVWEDCNGDGIQDQADCDGDGFLEDEPGMQGVTVNLLDCSGVVLDTMVTDGSGFYLFDNIDAGDYRVEFILPPDHEFTLPDRGGDDALDSDADPVTGMTVCTSISEGETNTTLDAGLVRIPDPGRLGDFAWEDCNGNGIQDQGDCDGDGFLEDEPGIPGVTVNLLDCSGGGLDTMITDADGFYLFDNLMAGNYMVEFVPPPDYEFTHADRGDDDAFDSDVDPATGMTVCTMLSEGETNRTLDAGLVRISDPLPARLGDLVWEDCNGNGIRDQGDCDGDGFLEEEPGVPGVTVNLRDCEGGFLESATTDMDRFYLFDNLLPGNYMVEFVLPPDYEFTLRDQGGDDAVDSDADQSTGMTTCIGLAGGEENLTLDAGLVAFPPECGDCMGKVTELSLRYIGFGEPALVEVFQRDMSTSVFSDVVAPGEIFTFFGMDRKGTLGTEITIHVNGYLNAMIHTSCSEPIGPGLLRGDFEVISGYSLDGGLLCPVETDCGCEGRVTRLTLQYIGDKPHALIEVFQRRSDVPVFSGVVAPGGTFTFSGTDNKGTLGTEISIFVDGDFNTEIHTSCSVPIGPGLIMGDFAVISGYSMRGGLLCPVDP